MTTTTVTLTKGDRLRTIQARLKNPDGTVCDLTSSTVAFLMVNAADGTVKVNYASATIVTAASGIVRYEWAANDVNAAADYYAWFRRTEGGLVEHFPTGGRRLKVVFVEAA